MCHGSKSNIANELVPKLKEELGITNICKFPFLRKSVLNMGLGEEQNKIQSFRVRLKREKSIAGQSL